MNGTVCCILGVCCPSQSDEQRVALAHEIESDLGCTPEEARKHADWIIDNFDLAPAGTLTAYRDAIAALARAKKEPKG